MCGIPLLTDTSDAETPNMVMVNMSSEEKKRKYSEDVKSVNVNSNNDETVAISNNSDVKFTLELSNKSDDSGVDVIETIGRSDSSSSSGYASIPCKDDNSDKDLKDTSEKSTCSSDSLFTSTESDSSLETTDSLNNVIFTTESFTNIKRAAGNNCPNVSISPLTAHRLPSVSSISSGRNSSFDEMDGVVPNMADILVVSHGGFIKKLIAIFIDKCGCKLPIGRKHGLEFFNNCGISKFIVSIHGREPATITCLLINDHDHITEEIENDWGL